MPDLITHVIPFYFLRKQLPAYFVLLMFGAVLPDLLSRGISIPGKWLLPLRPNPEMIPIHYYLEPIHAPLCLLLIKYLLSLLFVESIRQRVFLMIMLGAFSHLILDAMQRTIEGNGLYWWLFPFSWQSYEFGLLWPEDWLWGLPFLFLLYGLWVWREKKQH